MLMSSSEEHFPHNLSIELLMDYVL